MPNVVVMQSSGAFSLPAPLGRAKRNSQGLSTQDFRRILTDLRHRPPSQRAFLRKLLHRALLTSAPNEFPVVHHVVPDPITPS